MIQSTYFNFIDEKHFFADLSDQYSELVSPTPSLASEAASPANTASRHGSFSIPSPLHVSNSPAHHNLQYKISQQSTLVQSGPNSPARAGIPAQQYQSSTHSNIVQPQSLRNSFSPVPSTDMSQYSRGSVHNTSLDQHSFSEAPSNGHHNGQPRPGSLALASLAECGVLSDRAGYLARPGSLAAPCNTVGIPPAPTRAVSAATGLNYTDGSASALRSPLGYIPASPTTPNGMNQYNPVTPTADSKLPCGAGNYSNYGSSGIVSPSTNGGAKYSQPQSRIPMNRQHSSSSVGSSKGGSRIPAFASPQPNISATSKLPNVPEMENKSHSIPQANRSYGGVGQKSNSSEQYPNNRVSSNESRIPSLPESSITNGGRTSNIPAVSGSRGYSASPTPQHAPSSYSKASPYTTPPNSTGPASKSQGPTHRTPYVTPPKASGIPMAGGYSRSNSSHSITDGRITPANGGSFGKSGLNPSSSKSKLPLSANSSFDSTRDHKSPLSRIPSAK